MVDFVNLPGRVYYFSEVNSLKPAFDFSKNRDPLQKPSQLTVTIYSIIITIISGSCIYPIVIGKVDKQKVDDYYSCSFNDDNYDV